MPRRTSRGLAGGWSGYFAHDSFTDAIFDITEWVDRERDPAVVRYAYQVRYCSGLRDGARWQYRLDYHPIDEATVFVPHYHDEPAMEHEHAPRAWGRFLHLREALSILEQHAASRIGTCSGEAPGLRGRAPHQPGMGNVIIER